MRRASTVHARAALSISVCTLRPILTAICTRALQRPSRAWRLLACDRLALALINRCSSFSLIAFAQRELALNTDELPRLQRKRAERTRRGGAAESARSPAQAGNANRSRRVAERAHELRTLELHNGKHLT